MTERPTDYLCSVSSDLWVWYVIQHRYMITADVT